MGRRFVAQGKQQFITESYRMAWVAKDHSAHPVSTPLLCAGSPTSRPGCPEPHPAWPWMPPGMGHPQPPWAICAWGFWASPVFVQINAKGFVLSVWQKLPSFYFTVVCICSVITHHASSHTFFEDLQDSFSSLQIVFFVYKLKSNASRISCVYYQRINTLSWAMHGNVLMFQG